MKTYFTGVLHKFSYSFNALISNILKTNTG